MTPFSRSAVCGGNLAFERIMTLAKSKVSLPTPLVCLNWTSSSLLPSSLSGYESTTFSLRWRRSKRNSSLLRRTADNLLKLADKDIKCLMSNERVRRLSLTSITRFKWSIRGDRALQHLLRRSTSHSFWKKLTFSSPKESNHSRLEMGLVRGIYAGPSTGLRFCILIELTMNRS